MQGAVYPSLKDRTVLVTGGGSGIGEAIVRQFINQGARVGFIDIDLTSSEQLLSDLGAQARVHFEHADLRDIGALRRAVAGIREALGPITILVNNAARDDRHAIEDVTPEFWDERIAVNLKHQFFSAQAVAPDMRQAGGGAIINIGSVSWVIGQGNMPCYTTAKSAVQGLTRALARDLGPHNVRVNSILPGWIMTQRQQDLWLTPEGVAELMQRQCLKRKLVPDDIARVVLFFAADDSGACTNQSHIVDGGWV
ncbi:SDR family oxidoreductase [Bradyrhizobium viridifuturi]|jgi:NAD(P)-dependent dehydrogenase (short-subunit alcohol dehydrogenase family)|nr:MULTISPECIES: SDR family oxidoreductase [Bradyrhizobium]ERF86645.1 MAG: benzoylformate decarboxylase [Bradyrhizobium sp. DFCI-1]OYU62961.1 MAG: NAD(P)-dependent oxidoreductase [Bradyrhizobium sp. PARBB1]PSO29179.1 SDR family NAD(P)-dependent oxidoreductase [Bradyrhizobium sp. MOS004]QRI70941.1 SDR family oxidoreductase [Bradyrhizobium sp. PSBB068]MBR1020505.1 SDR family oxidoreductase [Bradyrhizobium viridifuturi]